MPTLDEVEYQLSKAGFRGWILGRAETKELPSILRPAETIRAAVAGFYEAGTAMLVATEERLLFIDKRFYHCRCDEIAYDSIGSTDYQTNLLTAKVIIQYRGGRVTLSRVRNRLARQIVRFIDTKIERPQKIAHTSKKLK